MRKRYGNTMEWPATARFGLTVAPRDLGLVQDFLNTIGSGRTTPRPDLLGSLESSQLWAGSMLDQWISTDDFGWAKPLPQLTEDDRQRLLTLRAHLFHALYPEATTQPVARTAHAIGDYRPALAVTADGIELKPEGEGWRYYETALLLLCHHAQTVDSLKRMKSCKAHGCDVVFYDRSNNNSGVWHDVKLCGNRANVRAHRQRVSSH